MAEERASNILSKVAGPLDEKQSKTRQQIIDDPNLRVLYKKGQQTCEDGVWWEATQDEPTSLGHFKLVDQTAKDAQSGVDEINAEIIRETHDGTYLMNDDGEVYFVAKADGIETAEQKPVHVGRFLVGNEDGEVVFEPTATGINTPNQLALFPGELMVGNEDGEVAFWIDADGKIHYAGQNDGGGIVATNPLTGLTLGAGIDSLSTVGTWQAYIAEKLGMLYDHSITISGKDGYAPTAVGGSQLTPYGPTSGYWRLKDIKHYNFGAFILYGAQNDTTLPRGTEADAPFHSDQYFQLDSETTLADAIAAVPSGSRGLNDTVYFNSGTGRAFYQGEVNSLTIGDEDYLDTANWSTAIPTTYAVLKGVIEELQRDNPTMRLYVMTLMRYWIPKIYRSDGYIDVAAMEASEREPARLAICDAQRYCAKLYGVPVLELWDESGISYDNADQYYPGVSNVHPNELGYQQGMGGAIYKQMT